MPESVKPIAAIQGGASEIIQGLLREFAEAVAPRVRVAGAVERERAGADPELSTLGDGRRFPIFQNLGPSSTACSVDSAGIVTACGAVLQDIAAGCDLLVLSKFGKLEAERSGLSAAFAAGVAAQIPILTSVAPKFDAQWRAFAAPLFEMLPPRMTAIEAWWREAAAGRRRSRSLRAAD